MSGKLSKIFIKNLARLLSETGISQNSFANKCGVTQASVSRYITGKTIPNLDTVEAIAKFFGVDASRLLGEEKGGGESEAPGVDVSLFKVLTTVREMRRELAQIEKMLEGMV